MTNMIFTSAVWTINIKALDHKLDTALCTFLMETVESET